MTGSALFKWCGAMDGIRPWVPIQASDTGVWVGVLAYIVSTPELDMLIYTGVILCWSTQVQTYTIMSKPDKPLTILNTTNNRSSMSNNILNCFICLAPACHPTAP